MPQKRLILAVHTDAGTDAASTSSALTAGLVAITFQHSSDLGTEHGAELQSLE